MIVENGLGAYLCTRAHLDEYYNFLTNLCFITTWNVFRHPSYLFTNLNSYYLSQLLETFLLYFSGGKIAYCH